MKILQLMKKQQLKRKTMNYTSLIILSFMVGVMVVIQGGLNARLGTHLNSPLLATSVAFTISASFTIIAILVSAKQFPSVHQL